MHSSLHDGVHMSITHPNERSVGHWARPADHHGRPTAQWAPPPQSSTCHFSIGSRRRFDEAWLLQHDVHPLGSLL